LSSSFSALRALALPSISVVGLGVGLMLRLGLSTVVVACREDWAWRMEIIIKAAYIDIDSGLQLSSPISVRLYTPLFFFSRAAFPVDDSSNHDTTH